MNALHTAIEDARQSVQVSQTIDAPGWRVVWWMPGSCPVSARTSGRKAAEAYARTVRIYVALRLLGYDTHAIHDARKAVSESLGAPTSLPGMVKACLSVLGQEQGR